MCVQRLSALAATATVAASELHTVAVAESADNAHATMYPLSGHAMEPRFAKIWFMSENTVNNLITGDALHNSTQLSVAVYFGNGVSRHKTYPKPFCLTSSPIGTVQATAGSQSYNEKL